MPVKPYKNCMFTNISVKNSKKFISLTFDLFLMMKLSVFLLNSKVLNTQITEKLEIVTFKDCCPTFGTELQKMLGQNLNMDSSDFYSPAFICQI